jgi:galactokinase
VGSAYNERRAQCEAAALHFGVPALRDVTPEAFEAGADGLAELPRRRARHVIGENARTLAAAEALGRGDADEMGRLMNASHKSLRDDFEVSSPALDAIVEGALAAPGCVGARMTGAGFGGCAVALVRAADAGAFEAHLRRAYQQSQGREASVYLCRPVDGAGREP